MTNEELRIKIAEIYGWTDIKPNDHPETKSYGPTGYGPKKDWHLTEKGGYGYIPNYPEDLNAMREAEEYFINPSNGEIYIRNIIKVLGLTDHDEQLSWKIRHATARQLAEAFVKTWRETNE